MDRRNGGDSLAPPRPPKLLPRIHRPRAPEPTTMISELNAQMQNTQNTTAQTQLVSSLAATSTSLTASTALDTTTQLQQQQQQQNTTPETTAATATVAATITSKNSPQCTNNNQQQQFGSNNNNNNNNNNLNNSRRNNNHTNTQLQQHHHLHHTNILATAATNSQNISNNNNTNNNNNNVNNNNDNFLSFSRIAVIPTQPNCDDYQIHHLTFLPQRPSSLSRNSSHVSSTSSSSSITAASSFTRQRPQPPQPINSSNINNNSSNSNSSSSSSSNSSNISNSSHTTSGSAVPLLSIVGNTTTLTSTSNNSNVNSNSISSNFLSHFQSVDPPVPAQTVTLAQPRPESERLANEYVDTPLRTAQQLQQLQQLQLQHTPRTQHPAGQHDGGQTTTHHLLLLPQRELRLQQQQQHHLQQQQQQQHQQPQLLHLLHQHHQQQFNSSRLAGTAGSAIATTENVGSGSGGGVGSGSVGGGTDGIDGFIHSQNHKTPTTTSTIDATTGKILPQKSPRTFYRTNAITEPITKQPASSCKFAKDLPALDELLDMHNISTGISTPQGMVSAVNGASPLGTPIIIGGDTTSLNPIMCPRCERCRCEQCQSPRPLPQTWVCNKTCLCSAESIIDYASCLCCAKALFYHCARDNDMDCDDGSSTPCVDNPCSCGPYKRTQRWGWLGALSLLLPCLLCYWPMRGCVAICEKCYGRYAGRGCRCQQIGSTSSMLPIVQLGISGGVDGVNSQMQCNAISQSNTKSLNGSSGKNGHHHHHHNDCSAASKILRKGDLTPEKRLLDSNPEY